MDPLSQGALGAALPQAASSARYVATAGLLGFFAGMAPDLDVLIRSSTDPLLFLEYHRQFTHALIFIPVGGLLCALVLHQLLGRRRGLLFRQSFLFCTLGYATHALLDACTTYGTMLLWPFSDARIAWNTISIIDPLFTLPLVLGVLVSGLSARPVYVRLALLWAAVYMGLGMVQRDAAQDMGYALAAQRGHEPLRLEAKPSFGNILVWKVVYETSERFYVDAVRARWQPRVYPGDSVRKLVIARDMPWLDTQSQQARDISRFDWFSNGYVALDPDHPNRVIDVRYSMVPNEVDALWSLQLDKDAASNEHADYLVHRDADSDRAERLWAMLFGP
ncbi:MAG: metal-dependent hydrolase [Gammaproteobacteria bacterium]|jgi:inner membrane protein|nr:metal-dependent hydrolase [Gammaproteobacteria bacterium]